MGKQNRREKQNQEVQEGRERESPLQLATWTKRQVLKRKFTDIRRQVFSITKENTWKATYKAGLTYLYKRRHCMKSIWGIQFHLFYSNRVVSVESSSPIGGQR